MNAPHRSAPDERTMLEVFAANCTSPQDFADVAKTVGIDISSKIPDFLESSDRQDAAYVRFVHQMRIAFGTWIAKNGKDTLQGKLNDLTKNRSEQPPESAEAMTSQEMQRIQDLILDARGRMGETHIFDRQVGGNRLRKFDRPDSLSPAAARGLYCILQSPIENVHALFNGGSVTKPTTRADKRAVAQIIGYLRRYQLFPIISAEATDNTSSTSANE